MGSYQLADRAVEERDCMERKWSGAISACLLVERRPGDMCADRLAGSRAFLRWLEQWNGVFQVDLRCVEAAVKTAVSTILRALRQHLRREEQEEMNIMNDACFVL